MSSAKRSPVGMIIAFLLVFSLGAGLTGFILSGIQVKKNEVQESSQLLPSTPEEEEESGADDKTDPDASTASTPGEEQDEAAQSSADGEAAGAETHEEGEPEGGEEQSQTEGTPDDAQGESGGSGEGKTEDDSPEEEEELLSQEVQALLADVEELREENVRLENRIEELSAGILLLQGHLDGLKNQLGGVEEALAKRLETRWFILGVAVLGLVLLVVLACTIANRGGLQRAEALQEKQKADVDRKLRRAAEDIEALVQYSETLVVQLSAMEVGLRDVSGTRKEAGNRSVQNQLGKEKRIGADFGGTYGGQSVWPQNSVEQFGAKRQKAVVPSELLRQVNSLLKEGNTDDLYKRLKKSYRVVGLRPEKENLALDKEAANQIAFIQEASVPTLVGVEIGAAVHVFPNFVNMTVEEYHQFGYAVAFDHLVSNNGKRVGVKEILRGAIMQKTPGREHYKLRESGQLNLQRL